MSQRQHWIVAGAFLLVTVGSISLMVKKGIESGKASAKVEQDEIDRKALLAEQEAKRIARNKLRRDMQNAIALARQGQFAQASAMLQILAENNPNKSSLWLNLGLAQVGEQKDAAAKVSFQKVVKLDAEDYDAIAELANIEKRGGKLGAALALLNKIPAYGGRMKHRLKHDPLWQDVLDNDGVKALRKKHGLDAVGDTSERLKDARKKNPDAVIIKP